MPRPAPTAGGVCLVMLAVACQAPDRPGAGVPEHDTDTPSEDSLDTGSPPADLLAANVRAHAVSTGAGPTRLATVEGDQIWIRTASADGWSAPVEGPTVGGTELLAFGNYAVSEAGVEVLSWEERHGDGGRQTTMATRRAGDWTLLALPAWNEDALAMRESSRIFGGTERQFDLLLRDADTVGMAWTEVDSREKSSLWYAEHGPAGWSEAQRVRTIQDVAGDDVPFLPLSISAFETETGIELSVGLIEFTTVSMTGVVSAAAQTDAGWEASRSHRDEGWVYTTSAMVPLPLDHGARVDGTLWCAAGSQGLWSLDGPDWVAHDLGDLHPEADVDVRGVGDALAVFSIPAGDVPHEVSVLVGQPPDFIDAAQATDPLPDAWDHKQVLFGADADGLLWVAESRDPERPLLSRRWSAAAGFAPVREVEPIEGTLTVIVRVGDGWELLSYEHVGDTLHHTAL